MRQLESLAIVGVGLIGASIGLAARRAGQAKQIVGIGRRENSLAVALSRGACDRVTTRLADGIANADLVVVCTPVDAIAATIQQAVGLRPQALVTDAGSTKAEIVSSLSGSLPAGSRFVGSHPLAGDSKAGPEFARADLFEGRTVVVTPTPESARADVADLTDFWRSLGANVLEMSPDAHDRAVAVTSHLPHLLASAIAGSTSEHYFPLIATGWLDTTRIAAGDAALWRQILLANRANVVAALTTFDTTLAALREALENADASKLELLLDQAKRNRDAVGS
jgi:prephenate dehydrogenase